MTEVLQEELNTLKDQHHKEVCAQKEFNDSTFGDKVRERAYIIWCNTKREDSQTNYFQALEEIRKEMCDCEEYLKQFIVVKEKKKFVAEPIKEVDEEDEKIKKKEEQKKIEEEEKRLKEEKERKEAEEKKRLAAEEEKKRLAAEEEKKRLLGTAFDNAVAMLTKNKNYVEQLAQLLLEKETITSVDLEKIMGKRKGVNPVGYSDLIKEVEKQSS